MNSSLRIALAAGLLLLTTTALAGPWNDPVIKGYDPVAYFTEGKAVKGKPEIASTHEGGKFWFASEDNRRQFEEDSEKYAPRFGGFCALGMANGMLLDSDPEAFTVYQDRLFLNIDKDARATWQENRDKNIRAAEGFWPKTYEETP